MADDAAFIWDQPTRQRPPRPPRSADAESEPSTDERVTLREAERRFGVRVSTLRAWARRGSIDAVKHSEQWYVTPESIAHHLSRSAPRATPTERPAATGPTADGNAMLVPRDAWDRLMDQLGNLHEAGLHLAEARERAARAETEASFLRERLAEMRTERDELKAVSTPGRPSDGPVETPDRPSPWARFRDRYGWLWGRNSKRQ